MLKPQLNSVFNSFCPKPFEELIRFNQNRKKDINGDKQAIQKSKLIKRKYQKPTINISTHQKPLICFSLDNFFKK